MLFAEEKCIIFLNSYSLCYLDQRDMNRLPYDQLHSLRWFHQYTWNQHKNIQIFKLCPKLTEKKSKWQPWQSL